jgi:hypothetical protein
LKAIAAAACVALLAWGDAAATPPQAVWRNLTTGQPMRAGIYGRIEVRQGTAAPPLVHAKPVTVDPPMRPRSAEPLYLYVPPGQLRRWARHCGKWDACGRPVYFVRVDDSPSRLGDWKKTQRPQPQLSFVLNVLERPDAD